MLRNRDIFRSRESISTTDQLTGVGNRWGFDEAQAQRLVNDLRARYRSSGISMALGYIVCQTPIANIDDVLSQVDKKMYADKERIYGRRHP